MEDFISSIKSNPVIIGLGVVLLVVGIVILHGKAAQTSPIPAIPTNDTTSGGTSDTSVQNGGPGTNGTNVFYSNPITGVGPTGPTGPAGPSGPTGPTGPTGNPGPSVHIEPSPKNTPGMSNNFWVYTTGKADTLKYINDNVGKWAKFGSSYLVGYRNNLQVLQSWGVDTGNYTKVLPSGMRLSV